MKNECKITVLDTKCFPEYQVAYQASKRGGTLYCRRAGSRIFMAGKAALYSIDELFL